MDPAHLAAARLWAASRHPYLAAAVFAVSVHQIDGLAGIQVDEWWRVHVDPVLASEWSTEQLGGELLHLTAHLLRDHATRARAIGPTDAAELAHWVDAADAEIDDDFGSDPVRARDAVTPAALDAAVGRLAEEYYLAGSPRSFDASEALDPWRDCGSGAHGRHAPWEPPPPRQGGPGVEREQQELIRRQVAAEVLAAGEPPDGIRRWAEAHLRPVIDWRTELAALVRGCVSARRGVVDYSYHRPSRRSAALAAQGHGSIVLPSLRDPQVDVAVVCDTSASVSDGLLARALAEVDGILRAAGVASVRVLACDDAVQATSAVRRSGDVVLLGGGGTDMAVGLTAAVEHRPRPQVVVVLTDGYTPWPEESPDRCRVVVGLLGSDEGGPAPQPAPDWASVVPIDPEPLDRRGPDSTGARTAMQ